MIIAQMFISRGFDCRHWYFLRGRKSDGISRNWREINMCTLARRIPLHMKAFPANETLDVHSRFASEWNGNHLWFDSIWLTFSYFRSKILLPFASAFFWISFLFSKEIKEIEKKKYILNEKTSDQITHLHSKGAEIKQFEFDFLEGRGNKNLIILQLSCLLDRRIIYLGNERFKFNDQLKGFMSQWIYFKYRKNKYLFKLDDALQS